MVEYVLDWCEKAFFPRITILCPESAGDEMEEALDAYKARKGAQSTADNASATAESDFFEFSNSVEIARFGGSSSGEVFLYLRNATLKPHEQIVLLPCDFITNLPPQVLIEAYRCRDESDLGMLVYYKNQLDIEDKKNKIFPKNYTVFTELPTGKAQFLDYYSSEDVDFQKGFKIRTQLLWNHPKPSVSRKLLNASIFFGDANLILAEFLGNPEKYTDAYFSSRPLIKIIRDLARREWQSPTAKRTVGFSVVPHQASFMRANNLSVYMEANRRFLTMQARETAGSKAGPKDKTAANVGADSMVGEGTSLGEKTNVKRSVVGANCRIGKRVKLTGLIILDNVTIEDDVSVENTIVGHDAIIHSKSKLTNCYVESTHEVAKGTQSKGDTLLCLTLEGLVKSAVESSSLEEEDLDESYEDYDEEYGDNSDGLFAY